MRRSVVAGLALLGIAALGAGIWLSRDPGAIACLSAAEAGIPPIADSRADRFAGKSGPIEADCAGSPKLANIQKTPWVDWQAYWAAGDENSVPGLKQPKHTLLAGFTDAGRGFLASLIDLERARIELVKFNLYDNLTYQDFVMGGKIDGKDRIVDGRVLKTWPKMQWQDSTTRPKEITVLDSEHQVCTGNLIRFRTLDGICNDVNNPLMGSTGMPFGRNVPFEATFPEKLQTKEAEARHGDRLTAAPVDPQVISRLLFTRQQSDPAACAGGYGTKCDYVKADTLNVLAGFWIQFMTHDWFTHLDEGNNSDRPIPIGCDRPGQTGCTPGMEMEAVLVDEDSMPGTFIANGAPEMERAYRTTRNLTTAWWDASQIYGYSDASFRRVKGDETDPAKLLLVPSRTDKGDLSGYLTVLQDCEGGTQAGCTPDPMNPKWAGQEAVAFPENWSIGTSFLHTVFVREHNIFVDEFRKHAAANPKAASGLRRPDAPTDPVPYDQVTDEEIFQIARLVVAAEIAKIHTTEWTTQLLYNEPLRTAMFSNWYGLSDAHPMLKDMLEDIAEEMHASKDPDVATAWYSAFEAGPGIVGSGTGETVKGTIDDVEYINGGTNHFGVPFNFTEEFVSVYRLHSLIPDLIEVRTFQDDPNKVARTLPVVETFRGQATAKMQEVGLTDLALSFGRQRAGALTLGNHPAFLQNLDLKDPAHPGRTIDVAALDILRDRERGIPKFNEFRRQIGLRPLTSFDDFIDAELNERDPRDLGEAEAAILKRQKDLVQILRKLYGSRPCDETKIISTALKIPDANGKMVFPDDCLGTHREVDGVKVVDNVEDLDTIVGYLAESTRPHGFAISETQFQIFIINASRRLFSDRFFTSSFRPEFYSQFGYDWVINNGPVKMMEQQPVNGHIQAVAPMKRVLLRTIPELQPELEHVINSFDPWARDRGAYYSTAWEPRRDAKADISFADPFPRRTSP